MSLEIWKEATKEKIDDLINGEPNENKALLLNSLIGVLNYCNNQSEKNRFEIIDFVPHSLVDEKMQESLKMFIEYMNEKSLLQTTGIKIHDEYALKAINEKLSIDSEIIEMIFKSANKEERNNIRKSYNDILNNILII